MLTKISLDNFKSISTGNSIELRNFSMLCGANSSGKSSLIQAILMMSQTFSSRYDFDEIVLNGHLVRLGAFGDIKSHRSEKDPISVSFMIETTKLRRDAQPTAIEYKVTFGRRPGSSVSLDSDYHPVVLKAEIVLTRVQNSDKHVDRFEISRAGGKLSERGSGELGAGTIFRVDLVELPEMLTILKDYPDAEVIGCEGNSVIPSNLLIEYNYTKKISAYIIALITGNAGNHRSPRENEMGWIIPLSFFFKLKECIQIAKDQFIQSIELPNDLRDMLLQPAKQAGVTVEMMWRKLILAKFALEPDLLDEPFLSGNAVSIGDWILFVGSLDEKVRSQLMELMDKKRSELQTAWDSTTVELRRATIPLPTINNLSTYLTSYFSRSVKYLGPLRIEPQAVYASLGQTDPRNIGLKGEFTAAVLHINRNRSISYPTPMEKPDGRFSFVTRTAILSNACREWLAYLGVICEYMTQDRGKLGYELSVRVTPGDRWQDLTHVGVGVSQVLPIVLMFLLSEPGDLLVFEQPELHLHPKVQSRLCDFFCAMTASGRQCIVETHSEYMINRLRLRIVQSTDAVLQNSSSIFFLTKEDYGSKFEQVEVNGFGAIMEWPKDFFDQTDAEVESILLEASKKRRAQKKEAHDASSSVKL